MTEPTEQMPRRPSEPNDLEKLAAFRALLARRLAVVALVALVVLALAVVTYGVLVIRDAQVTNTKRSVSNNRTLAAIEDCTQPTGECFRRGQKQTAKAVGDINRVVILASACSVGLDQRLSVAARQDAISQCVINRLAASPTGR